MPSYPLVSIIVPTRNRPGETVACVQSVRAQSYENIEIIVVDGNSTDNTRETVAPVADQVIVFPKRGDHRCAQRNLGVKNAKGEYVLIIDSDMTLSPTVISSCVEKMQDEKVKGIIIPEESFGEGFWAKCKKLEKSFYIGVDAVEAARFFRKVDFEAVGGYNELLTSGEDWDLSDRIEMRGSLARVDDLIYHNEGQINLFQTIKKKYYYSQKAASYISETESIPTAKKRRAGIFSRYGLFFRQPAKLFRNPLLGIGMLFMKTCEFGAGGMGYLFASKKIKKETWVIGASSGKRFCDNAKYLYLHLISNRKEGREVVWLTRSSKILQEVRSNGGKAYLTYSFQGIINAIRSNVVIRSYSLNDVGYLSYLFSRRKLLVNLSHGIPFKKMDTFLRPKTNSFFRSIFLFLIGRDADVVISESVQSNKDLKTLYKKDSIIVTGGPRTDILIKEKDKKSYHQKMVHVFYAPTWRDYPYNFIDYKTCIKLDEFLAKNNMTLSIKWHGSEKSQQIDISSFKNIAESLDDVTSELFQSDVLITDYSSIFLDYLLLDRPIIFSSFDLEKYSSIRGFHYEYNEVTPGPKTDSWQDVMNELSNIASGVDNYKESRKVMRDFFHTFHDGKNSSRVVSEIERKLQNE